MSYGPHTRNPWDDDQSPPEDDRRLCACQDPRCWIVLGDETNVIVKGDIYACDCVGLCTFCGQLDSLHRLIRVSGSWLSHPDCASQVPVIAERDEMNERRR